jgi:hypothetical protein
MKNTTLKYCLVLLFISSTSCLTAQSTTSALPDLEPSDLVRQYMLNHPNENFVIQTDRDLYFSGTELWFSVWSLDDQTLSPFSYSGIVYIELKDKNGASMAQQTLKLEKNKASGRIFLPEQMASGNYYLQVYSNLQRNYGEHLFGIKIVQVINPSKPPELTLMETRSEPKVSLFPEGQRLLYGITNKLVIKATFPNGVYASLTEGYLIRRPFDTIAQLDFLIPGMGYCSFYADSSYTYHLDLPGFGLIPLEIEKKGLTIGIKEGEGQLKLCVLGMDNNDMEKQSLIGKTGGQVFFEQALEPGLEEVNFPWSALPGGLLEFSILNSGFEEYCQRLYYNDRSHGSIASELLLKKSSFKKGEAIDIEIILPEEKEFELLSLVVRKDIFINDPLNQNFKSCIDLHPFLNDWDEFAQLIPLIPIDSLSDIMDIYLITRKSSRYKWQNMFRDLPEKLDFMPEVNFKRVTGYVFNPKNSKRISNDNLLLYFVDKEASILNSRTDSEGRFSFDYPIDKTGISEIGIQAFGHKDGMEISMDWPFHQPFHNYKLDFFHFDSTRLDEYDTAYFQSLLEKMYRDKDIPAPKKEERGMAFYGVPDSRTYLQDYVSMINMEEVFKEIVPGEKIRIEEDEYSLQLFRRDDYVLLGDNPLLLFNGAPFQDIKELLGIPVSRVDFVDIVRQHYKIQNQVFDGIINIVSKDLNLQLMIPPNVFKTTLEVFPQVIRFSGARENHEDRIPNLNPTLYWNPDLFVEGNSRHISFKAGDNSGRYQVLLRGIDTEGNILELIKYILIE